MAPLLAFTTCLMGKILLLVLICIWHSVAVLVVIVMLSGNWHFCGFPCFCLVVVNW
jgi:hypothetical protein